MWLLPLKYITSLSDDTDPFSKKWKEYKRIRIILFS